MDEYFVTANLVLETALHIGSGKGEEPTDAPVRRMGDGRLLIPASGIAGSLRATATRLAPRLGYKECQTLLPDKQQDNKKPCGCAVCQLFGDVHPAENASASRLWIQDAFADADSPVFVRDGVGINRVSGHAAKNVKFDYEVVPRGTAFPLAMRLIYETDVKVGIEKDTKILLTAVLIEWEKGRGQLGGNIARGLGRFRLDGLAFTQPQLGSAADLTAYLKASDRASVSQPVPHWPDALLKAARAKRVDRQGNGRAQSIAASFVKVSFSLQFTDLFLQHDPLTALISGFDHAPLIEKITDDGLGNPVLAGSSLRGVLRNQAGKIIRTLYTNYCLDNEDDPVDAFLYNCPACNVLEDNRVAPIASCNSRLDVNEDKERHHEWQEDDFCLTCQLFGNQERGSRLQVQDGVWQEADRTIWQAQDFLAIDRFTGGGLDGAKFDAAPLVNAQFQTAVTLHDPAEWELGLLVLLLRDLADKRITIGFGAAKGYGQVQAADFVWEVGCLTDNDAAAFPTLTAVDSGVYQVSENKPTGWLPDAWQDMAEGWVKAFNKTVETFTKPPDLQALTVDTFFGHDTAELYGRSRAEVN